MTRIINIFLQVFKRSHQRDGIRDALCELISAKVSAYKRKACVMKKKKIGKKRRINGLRKHTVVSGLEEDYKVYRLQDYYCSCLCKICQVLK